jgi:zinc transport system substrate-binding protein
MVTRIVLITAVGIAGMLAAGCGGGDTRSDRSVVAGFYPLAYAAEEVGGGMVEVRNLTPPGTEPHDFELSARSVKDVRDADLVLYLGEGFMPSLERAVKQGDAPSLDLLAGESLIQSADEHSGSGGEADGLDPHVWLDPVRFARMAKAIAVELGDASLADELVRRLDVLDGELESGLGTCKRREIVTSHAAFGYLAARYDLEQIPLSGLSPEVEPSAKEIAALAVEVKEVGATTVFFETLVSPKLADTVAREAGAKTAMLNPIEGLTADEIAAGDDYFSVMRDNLAILREALGCA